MTLAFSVTETMRGLHHFVDPSLGPPDERPMYFRIDWGAPIGSALNPLSDGFMRHQATGTLFAEGLTPEPVPCTGALAVDYLRDHTITYDLGFSCAGAPYRYVGRKTDVYLRHPLQLIKTHTTCYGAITDAQGRTLSRSVLHFPPETALPFLMSFRLRTA